MPYVPPSGGNPLWQNVQNKPFSTPSDYGSLQVGGSVGGWAGFSFSDINRSLLANASAQGFYNPITSNWIWRFNNGSLDIGSVPWNLVTNRPVGAIAGITGGSDNTPYGAVDIPGVSNSYSGFSFSGVNRAFLVRSDLQGIWAGGNWDWLWQNGVLLVGSVPWGRLSSVPTNIVYETSGTWTPVLSPGNHTYGSNNYGIWWKIGSLVTVEFCLHVTSKDVSVGQSSPISISLPFIRKALGVPLYSIGKAGSYSGVTPPSSNYAGILVRVGQGSSVMALDFEQAGTAQSVTLSSLSGIVSISGSITYPFA